MGKKSGNSLQDQLLKAGLADKKKVKQVKDQQYKAKKTAKKTKQVQQDENQLELERQREEKLAKDRLLNQQKEEAARAKAIVAQIHQLIDMNRITQTGEVKYNFSHLKKVKTVQVTEQLQKDLSGGRVGIVLDRNDRYAIVPAGVIEKIAARDNAFIVSLHEKSTPMDKGEAVEDDPYAEFEVPDDLMW